MINIVQKNKKFVLVPIIIFLISLPFVLKSEREIFLKKTKIFCSILIEKEIFGTKQIQKLDTTSVWAAYPPSVNSLPTCGFTNGNVGDIFAKNSGCSWSDYKCTLTNYDQCDSGVDYYGSPWGDYCWCSYDYSKVCAIQHPNNGVACWSWKDGTNYSEYCDLCVRR
jgi:hypothetical protein